MTFPTTCEKCGGSGIELAIREGLVQVYNARYDDFDLVPGPVETQVACSAPLCHQGTAYPAGWTQEKDDEWRAADADEHAAIAKVEAQR